MIGFCLKDTVVNLVANIENFQQKSRNFAPAKTYGRESNPL